MVNLSAHLYLDTSSREGSIEWYTNQAHLYLETNSKEDSIEW